MKRDLRKGDMGHWTGGGVFRCNKRSRPGVILKAWPALLLLAFVPLFIRFIRRINVAGFAWGSTA